MDKGVKHLNLVNFYFKGSKSNKIMLEMGPGGTLIHGFMSIVNGWGKYVAVDAFPSDIFSPYPLKLYKLFRDTLDEDKTVLFDKLLTSAKKGNGPVSYYGNKSLFGKEFNDNFKQNSIDFIYSWGCS